MSDLIDHTRTIKVEIGGEWWIAKPCKDCFIIRLRNAWKVLKGTARAFHYKQDECDELNKLFNKKTKNA